MSAPLTREEREQLVDERAAQYAAAASWREEAVEQLKRAVVYAVGEGMTESEAARRAGVQRMTIRAWVGK